MKNLETPFDGFVLEDFVRHLATWPMPDIPEKAPVISAILLLCREWVDTNAQIVP